MFVAEGPHVPQARQYTACSTRTAWRTLILPCPLLVRCERLCIRQGSVRGQAGVRQGSGRGQAGVSHGGRFIFI